MNDLILFLPELLITSLAFLIISIDMFYRPAGKNLIPLLTITSLLAILTYSLVGTWNTEGSIYDGLLVVDKFSVFFKSFFIILVVIVILSSVDYVKTHFDYRGEYYGLLLFTLVAMMLMVSSRELLTSYISLELLSFGLYVLVAYERFNLKSNEAGTKFILLGALSSAFLLYGISQIYGLLGTTRYDDINTVMTSMSDITPGVMVGILMLVAGLGFKVAAVPFHMWAPDTYEGAPIPVAAYIAVGSKSAAFALILRLFSEAFIPVIASWQTILIVLSVLTIVFGNLGALVQQNIKRLLAYSGIAHSGYLLMGVSVLATHGVDGSISTEFLALISTGIIFHIVAYSITNMGAFLSATAILNATRNEDILSMAGFSRKSPVVAIIFTSSLFSLAGLPIFVGFISKFYLFNAVAVQGFLWVVGIAILASVISLYYYLMVIRQLYIEPAAEAGLVHISKTTLLTLSLLFAGMVILGVYPDPLVSVIHSASEILAY